MIDRRGFLKTLAGLTTGILLSSSNSEGQAPQSSDRLGTLLPLRKFGRTNETVTMLGVGGLAYR